MPNHSDYFMDLESFLQLPIKRLHFVGAGLKKKEKEGSLSWQKGQIWNDYKHAIDGVFPEKGPVNIILSREERPLAVTLAEGASLDKAASDSAVIIPAFSYRMMKWLHEHPDGSFRADEIYKNIAQGKEMQGFWPHDIMLSLSRTYLGRDALVLEQSGRDISNYKALKQTFSWQLKKDLTGYRIRIYGNPQKVTEFASFS